MLTEIYLIIQTAVADALSPPVGKFHDGSRATLDHSRERIEAKMSGEFLPWQCERSAVLKGTFNSGVLGIKFSWIIAKNHHFSGDYTRAKYEAKLKFL